MAGVCDPSPWTDAQHALEAGAQFQVMRELHLDIWDPNNGGAVERLNQLIAQRTLLETQQNPNTPSRLERGR